jgi:galactose mutarotase-like enzyme
MAGVSDGKARKDKGPGGMDLWTLTYGAALAEVVPQRGGLVSRFCVAGEEILYLDPATLTNRSQNVRGGIPVLFPIAGRLTGDRYTIPGAGQGGGRSFPMRQHGLARLAPWSVIDVAAAHLTMELLSNEVTRVNYPFDFALRLTVDVGLAGGRTLSLVQEVENRCAEPLPVHMGLHPYFAVPHLLKDGVRIETTASRAYDNIRGEIVSYSGVDLGQGEVDLHLLDHRPGGTRLVIPGRPARVLAYSDLYQVLVLWTLGFKDFVCVEPWSAPADALNSGHGLLFVPPGERIRGEFSITIEGA